MAIRESALIKILDSRIQNYQEMVEIAKENGCNTPVFESKMNGRIEEAESLKKLFNDKEDDENER